MASWGPARSADRADEVEIDAASEELRAFQGIGLGHPVVGIAPAFVDGLDRAIGPQAIVGKANPLALVEEEVAAAVFAHDMPGIDQAADAEIDGLAPGAAYRGRVDDVDVGEVLEAFRPGRLHEGDVDEVASAVLDKIGGKDRAERPVERRTYRRPVH